MTFYLTPSLLSSAVALFVSVSIVTTLHVHNHTPNSEKIHRFAIRGAYALRHALHVITCR